MVETVVSFQDISFKSSSEGVLAVFMGSYHFTLSREDLEAVGPFKVRDGDLVFSEREKRVWNRFNRLLERGFLSLHHRVRDKPCLYVHRNSGIPLLGTNEFGLVDRGSNIIEVKPLTGCNLSCTFCSVNEGVNDKSDIVVEEEYLVEEFAKLTKLKVHPVEANIGPQGEPLLYPRMVDLVRDLKATGGAAVVSVNTNGTLLSERLIDDLAEAGLDRINLSLHSLLQEQVNEIMGGVQSLSRLKRMIAYCDQKVDVLLAPVLLPGVTDSQLDGLVALAKTIHNRKWPALGVQNFLEYPSGRNPGLKQRSWEEFFAILKEKEKELGYPLVVQGDVFGIFSEDSPEKPFLKGEVIEVSIAARGRSRGEWLGVAKGRTVTVRRLRECRVGQSVKVKLLRDKHNIFTAVPA